MENILKREIDPQVVLKPQDPVVLLKLLPIDDQRRSFAEWSAELWMSASEAHWQRRPGTGSQAASPSNR